MKEEFVDNWISLSSIFAVSFLCTTLSGKSLLAQTDICDICANSLELYSSEANCFLSAKDVLIEEAQVAEPVLVNFSDCTVEGTSVQRTIRGDIELPEAQGCDPHKCERKVFAFLSREQMECLVELIEMTRFDDSKPSLLDFNTCD